MKKKQCRKYTYHSEQWHYSQRQDHWEFPRPEPERNNDLDRN